MSTQTQRQQQAANPRTSLTIRDSDLDHALGGLRNTPAADLSAIRAVRIALTESNLLYWQGSLPPGAHAVLDEEDLEGCAWLYPTPTSSSFSSSSRVRRE